MLEVCIDSLESAHNAIIGGADELEICSTLTEGGLTPSPGLVSKVVSMPKVNVMIRCRGGSDFCYTDQEIDTMLADIEVYKGFSIDRFVFGALTDKLEIDKINCTRIIKQCHPLPVTFHRAFDLCADPKSAIKSIVELGFNRILTSGKEQSADSDKAIMLLRFLFENFRDKIEIMPGAGINCYNAHMFIKTGFKIIHSSCKITKTLPNVGDFSMGCNVVYVTNENTVKEIKKIITSTG